MIRIKKLIVNIDGATIFLVLLAIFMSAVIFIVDTNVKLGFAIGAMYCIVIFYSWLLPGKLSSVYTGIFTTALVILGFVYSEGEVVGDFSGGINRIISIIVIWVCASLVAIAKQSFEELSLAKDGMESEVKDRTAELKSQMDELNKQHLKVQESELKFKYLLDSAPDAMIIINKKGVIQLVNQQVKNIFGYEMKDLIGKSVGQLFPERFMRTQPNQGAGFFENPKTSPMGAGLELLGLRKNGEEFPLEMSLSPMKIDNKDYVTAAIRDISNRKKDQLDIQRLYKAITELKDYTVILLDAEGKVERWNKGAEKILGYQEEEVLQKHYSHFIKNVKEVEGAFQLTEIAKKEGRSDVEFWVLKKGENSFWGNVILTDISNFEGLTTGYSMAINDLTERQRNEKIRERQVALEVKNKELEQFAYVASHDLQEPLLTISSFAQDLSENYAEKLDETGREDLNFILEATSRMKRLIVALLEYSKIGKNKSTVNFECSTIIGEVSKDLSSLIEETKAVVEWSDLPTMQGYKTEIRLLFQNLITNAIKFRKIEVSPRVNISCQQIQDGWEFSVEDNGIGIVEKNRHKIFEIFQRLHTENEFEGTGIGLSHCLKIVEMHGGKIWVSPNSKGGSTFHFTLKE
jgi:PAS domain S-box-containing protein